MMNKDISIKINRATRMVYLSKNIIGNDAENLQQNLVFTFEDDFVEGQARLEYRIDGEKRWVTADKQGDKYTVPVKSVMTKEGNVYMQLVITEGIDEQSVPIFKSNVFYMVCGQSINAELEQPEQYPSWIDIANTKLNQVDNLDIDANKVDKVATFEITKKDGSKKIVKIKDGKDGERGEKGERGEQGIQGETGPKGDAYVLTAQDKTDIANETKEIVMPDLEKEITLVEDKAGNRITLAVDKNYLMTLKLLNSKGKELSTASVDLPLETMVVNARYDSTTKELVIVLENGNELKVPIGDLVKGLVSQTTFDSTVKSLQEQITANNDELNQVVGEVSDAKQDIGLIKQEQTLQNKAIQKNVDDIIATNKGVVKNTARIQNIEGTLYDNGVAEGEFINIKDSALAEQQSVELGVNKAQESTKGYNLAKLGINNINLDYLKYNSDGINFDINSINLDQSIDIFTGERTGGYLPTLGTADEHNITPNDNKKYTVKLLIDKINGGTTGNNFLSIFTNKKQYNYYFNSNYYSNVNGTIQLTENEHIKSIYIWCNKANNPQNFSGKVLLYEGTEDKPYEIYTGGIPSPNPDYKQEINKITGSVEYTSCGKNLLKMDKFIDGSNTFNKYGITATMVDDGIILNGTSTSEFEIYFNKSKHTINGNDKINFISNGIRKKVFLLAIFVSDEKPYYRASYDNVPEKVGFKESLVMTEPLVHIYKDQTFDNFKLTGMVYLGNNDTPYTPYQSISNTIDLKGNEVLPGDKIRLRFNPMTGKYEKILKKNMSEEKKQNVTSVTIAKMKPNGKFYTNVGGTLNEQTITFSKEIADLDVVYELKDDLKTEINLGEIDIMNMTYYPVTNAFTDKENVLINMKYYRDFTNTIRNLQIDKDTLQAQLQDIESRVKALESRPVALSEPIESEVMPNA